MEEQSVLIGIGGVSITLGSWLMWYWRRSRPVASDVQAPMRPPLGHQLRGLAFLLLGVCFLALAMHFPTAVVQIGLLAVAALFVAAWAMDERDPLSEEPVEWGWFKLTVQQTNTMTVYGRSTFPIALLWIVFGLGAGLLADKMVHDPVSLGMEPGSSFGGLGIFLGGAGGIVQAMVLACPLGRATRFWRQWWVVALATISPFAVFMTFILMNFVPLCDGGSCALGAILFAAVYGTLPAFVLAFILTPIAHPLTNAVYRLQKVIR